MLIGKTGLNTIANEVQSQGYGAAHKASAQAGRNLGTSNFGNDTKIGSSEFQKGQERINSDGQKAVAEKMKDSAETQKNFSEKMSYQKNATLAIMQKNTLDISQ